MFAFLFFIIFLLFFILFLFLFVFLILILVFILILVCVCILSRCCCCLIVIFCFCTCFFDLLQSDNRRRRFEHFSSNPRKQSFVDKLMQFASRVYIQMRQHKRHTKQRSTRPAHTTSKVSIDQRHRMRDFGNLEFEFLLPNLLQRHFLVPIFQNITRECLSIGYHSNHQIMIIFARHSHIIVFIKQHKRLFRVVEFRNRFRQITYFVVFFDMKHVSNRFINRIRTSSMKHINNERFT
mmetsp:Transcript_55431/g.92128  ORF Transcript_55431/g.92128 Transcript_55431/m.92128 type:complete len:237 (-) Transcript_55431:2577-3287(-)